MKRGSITIGIIAGIGVPLFLAGVGYLISLSTKHNSDVKEINVELSQKGEVISALKANVGSLKEDTKEIRQDVKEILQRLPKK